MAKWLTSRYMIDAKSRNQTILREFLALFYDKEELDIIDLGSGIGSNFRYLHERLDADQTWKFIEIDKALIDASFPYLSEKLHVDIGPGTSIVKDEKEINIEIFHKDMLSSDVLNMEADAAVANAVFDLFSAEQFTQIIENLELPVYYFTINYNGTKFYPASEEDKKYLDLYDQHMVRDQQFGKAMGPSCANTMVEILNQYQYDTIIGSSDWLLDQEELELALFLINFMEESIPDLLDSSEMEDFTNWVDLTRNSLRDGELTIKILHDDILAIRKSNK